jgi:hypothetical protein
VTATSASLYSQAIGNNRFVASHLQLQDDGYTVESGNLLSPQGEIGALVMVRAPDGALTAFVSRDGESGLLLVSADGKQMFVPDTKVDFLRPDTVEQVQDLSSQVNSAPTSDLVYVDALVGFTQAALTASPVDPVAYAKAQMESVNLSLRNSKIENIELRLVGIRITAEDIPVSASPDGGGLRRWQTVLSALREQYQNDINVGFSVGGDAGGWAHVPGYNSVNLITAPTAFKHEMAHNVGGGHCNPDGGDNYKYGFNAGGEFTTNLCGNAKYYYSTPNPEVRPEGKVIGDARTADMARLWREQAGRLSGYSPARSGYHLIHVGAQSQLSLSVWGNKAAYMATSQENGPVLPVYFSPQLFTRLKVKVTHDTDGKLYIANLRGTCMAQSGVWVPMHDLGMCGAGNWATLKLDYLAADNPDLPAGWYNGTVDLYAKGPFVLANIYTSISFKK